MSVKLALRFPERVTRVPWPYGSIVMEKGPRGDLARSMLFDAPSDQLSSGTKVIYVTMLGDKIQARGYVSNPRVDSDGAAWAMIDWILQASPEITSSLGERAVLTEEFVDSMDSDVSGIKQINGRVYLPKDPI
jgi:hypothetical protein